MGGVSGGMLASAKDSVMDELAKPVSIGVPGLAVLRAYGLWRTRAGEPAVFAGETDVSGVVGMVLLDWCSRVL